MNDSLPAVSQRRSVASSNSVQDVIKSSASSSHVGIDRNPCSLPSVTSYSVGGRDDLAPPSYSVESEVTGTSSGAGRNFTPNHKVRFRAAGPLLSPWEDPPRGKRGGLKKFQEVPYQPKFEGSWASQMQTYQATCTTPARASISSLRNSRRSSSSEETGGPPSSGAPIGDSTPRAATHIDDRTSPPPSPGSDVLVAANSKVPTVSRKELAEFERAQVAIMVNSLREDAAELMSTRTTLQCEITQLEERVQELKQEEKVAMARAMMESKQQKLSASSPKSPAAVGDGDTLQEASSPDNAIPHSPLDLTMLHLTPSIDTAVPVRNQAATSAPGETATPIPCETAALAPNEAATSATSVTATSTSEAHASQVADEGQPAESAAVLNGERAEVESIAAATTAEPVSSQDVGPAAACHEPAEKKRSVEEVLAELELTQQRESQLASRLSEMELAATQAAEDAKRTSEQHDALVKELEAGRTSVQTAAVEVKDMHRARALVVSDNTFLRNSLNDVRLELENALRERNAMQSYLDKYLDANKLRQELRDGEEAKAKVEELTEKMTGLLAREALLEGHVVQAREELKKHQLEANGKIKGLKLYNTFQLGKLEVQKNNADQQLREKARELGEARATIEEIGAISRTQENKLKEVTGALRRTQEWAQRALITLQESFERKTAKIEAMVRRLEGDRASETEKLAEQLDKLMCGGGEHQRRTSLLNGEAFIESHESHPTVEGLDVAIAVHFEMAERLATTWNLKLQALEFRTKDTEKISADRAALHAANDELTRLRNQVATLELAVERLGRDSQSLRLQLYGKEEELTKSHSTCKDLQAALAEAEERREASRAVTKEYQQRWGTAIVSSAVSKMRIAVQKRQMEQLSSKCRAEIAAAQETLEAAVRLTLREQGHDAGLGPTSAHVMESSRMRDRNIGPPVPGPPAPAGFAGRVVMGATAAAPPPLVLENASPIIIREAEISGRPPSADPRRRARAEESAPALPIDACEARDRDDNMADPSRHLAEPPPVVIESRPRSANLQAYENDPDADSSPPLKGEHTNRSKPGQKTHQRPLSASIGTLGHRRTGPRPQSAQVQRPKQAGFQLPTTVVVQFPQDMEPYDYSPPRGQMVLDRTPYDENINTNHRRSSSPLSGQRRSAEQMAQRRAQENIRAPNGGIGLVPSMGEYIKTISIRPNQQ